MGICKCAHRSCKQKRFLVWGRVNAFLLTREESWFQRRYKPFLTWYIWSSCWNSSWDAGQGIGKKRNVSHSAVCNSLWPPWAGACQALLSMGFFMQEYWSGLPFLSPGDLSDPANQVSSIAGRLFTIWATREAQGTGNSTLGVTSNNKQQLEPDMEQQSGSKLGKGYIKNVYCHSAYLIYIEYIMWNVRLDEAQAGIKIAGRNVNNLRLTD